MIKNGTGNEATSPTLHRQLISSPRLDNEFTALVEHAAVINAVVCQRHFSDCEPIIFRVNIVACVVSGVGGGWVVSHFLAVLQPFDGVRILHLWQTAVKLDCRALLDTKRHEI